MLRRQFAWFLEKRGSDPDAEFLLSTAMNDEIAAGRSRVRILPASGPWLGVTYQDDRPYVVAKLRELVDAGYYPASLTLP
jgi:hypothetical protein